MGSGAGDRGAGAKVGTVADLRFMGTEVGIVPTGYISAITLPHSVRHGRGKWLGELSSTCLPLEL